MTLLAIFAAVLWFVSAVLWFASARVSIPTLYKSNGGTYATPPDDPSKKQELDPIVVALRKQSKLSGYAAICAGIAALLQMIVMLG
jgi:hypothetical protein